MVDSGTSMQILQYRLFTSQLSEDHTAVSGIRGGTSTATHRGDFNRVRKIHPSRRSICSPCHPRQSQKSFFPCDTLNTTAKLSYWVPKQDCYHTVIQICSFHSSKTNLLASGFYLYCNHRRHTLVSTSSLPQQSGTTEPSAHWTTSIKHKSRQR